MMESDTSYTSSGKQIPVECFKPGTPGKHPVVILVHGADGLTTADWKFRYHYYAKQLAEAGYLALFPHYFDSTGTKGADGATIVRNFGTWMKTVADAVSFAKQQANAEPKYIGLVGFSLGSSISMILASQDTRVGAVVEFFGAVPDFVAPYIKRMPPTLILHGDADWLVSVKEAYKVQDLLKQKKVPYEIKIYPWQGHGFSGSAENDAIARTTAFFNKYLKRGNEQVR